MKLVCIIGKINNFVATRAAWAGEAVRKDATNVCCCVRRENHGTHTRLIHNKNMNIVYLVYRFNEENVENS